MRAMMSDDSISMPNNSFLLDDDSRWDWQFKSWSSINVNSLKKHIVCKKWEPEILLSRPFYTEPFKTFLKMQYTILFGWNFKVGGWHQPFRCGAATTTATEFGIPFPAATAHRLRVFFSVLVLFKPFSFTEKEKVIAL